MIEFGPAPRAPGAVASEWSRLGFGGAAIGNLYRAVSENDARASIRAAFESGVRYFDTAPHYGFGLGEDRLGHALAELDPGARVSVSTKVGRVLQPISGPHAAERHGFVEAAPYAPVFDYSYDGVMRSYEASRTRLRRDRIDILFVHDLGRRTHADAHAARFREFMEGGYRALRRLRESGAVGAIGLGANEVEVCQEAIAAGDFDLVLLAGRYTLLEQGALDGLLPACAARGISVVVGGPFNSGVLALEEPGAEPPRYDYAPAGAEVMERVSRLQAACADFSVPLAAAALQFISAHPQVSAVIPGVATAAQARRAAALMAIPIPAGLWERLRGDGLLDPRAPTPITQAAAPSPTAQAAAPPPVMLLHPDDNVLVVRAPVRAGEALVIDGATVVAAVDLDIGHKLARRAMRAGEKVLKYGAPIGSMRHAAQAGDHIHMHNLQSDYISSHTRQSVEAAPR